MNHPNTEILHQNEVGKVMTCTCCEDMQVHFGNVMLQMPIQGVRNLTTVLHKMGEEYADRVPAGKYVIRTPQQNMFITATQSELQGLVELLDTSLYMQEVKKMLSETE